MYPEYNTRYVVGRTRVLVRKLRLPKSFFVGEHRHAMSYGAASALFSVRDISSTVLRGETYLCCGHHYAACKTRY